MTRTRRWLVHGKKPGGDARLPPCSGTEMTFRYANRRGCLHAAKASTGRRDDDGTVVGGDESEICVADLTHVPSVELLEMVLRISDKYKIIMSSIY
jgi:hypothetical protein